VSPLVFLRISTSKYEFLFSNNQSDLLNLAEREANLDFSFADVIIIVSNPNARVISRSATFAVLPGQGIRTSLNKTNEHLNVITLGADLIEYNAWLLAHELSHTLGLPDLYSYTSFASQHEFVGDWSLMGNIKGKVREYFGWERWIMSWLVDTQVMCVNKRLRNKETIRVSIMAIEELKRPNDDSVIKLVVIKLSETQVLAIESRRNMGHDIELTSTNNGGLLVYLVDTSLTTGHGGIKVLTNGQSYNDQPKLNSLLSSPGQMLSYIDITVRYVSRMDTNSDILEINFA
jgi:hypothetical protein